MAPTQSLEEAEKAEKPTVLPKLKAEPTVIQLADAPTSNKPQQPSANNCRVVALVAQQPGSVNDQVVDIVNGAGDRFLAPVKEEEDQNATECSSSFGDTLSGSCSEMNPEMSDSEVESPFARHIDAAFADCVTNTFNKKKVTPHWRKFISPLMWRCQWLELRIKEIQNQASRYDKELAMLKHEKDLHAKIIDLDNSCSRVVPLSSRCRNKKAMKRKKRKKEEETVDGMSYISDHIIFSYYENKRSETDGHSVDDDCGDQVDETSRGNDDANWLYGTGSGSYLEKLLLKIETVESRVSDLKSQLKKATAKKTKKPSFLPTITLPGDNNYAVQSPSCSPSKNRDLAILTRPDNGSDDEMAEAVLPGSAVSSYGDATDLGIIETTSRCPFSAADIALDPHHIQDFCKEENVEDVLIDNKALVEVHHLSMVKTEVTPVSEEESTAPCQSLGLKEVQISSLQKQLNLRSCYTGKRRGRKAKKMQKKQQMKKRKKTSIGSGATASGLWRSERVKKPKIRD